MIFKEQLSQYVSEIDQILEAYLPEQSGHQKIVFEAMNYSVRAGGKRIRPLLMQEIYRLFQTERTAIEPFMAAIEMIHTSSLVHDDLPCMDNDEYRRGQPTTWVQYGYDMAVLAGDALLIYAMETAVKAGELTDRADLVVRCMGILAAKSGVYGMIGGQTADVGLTGGMVNQSQLEFIYRLKTAALVEAAMMIGAVLGGANQQQVDLVETMAADIGMAFQIRDDVLDVEGDRKKLGKPIHSDERNNKTTYVTLNGLETAKAQVQVHSSKALAALEQLPGDHTFLKSVIEMLITREH